MRTKITKSNPSDAPVLTAIAKSAKKYWGYSRKQIKKWEEELTIIPQDIIADLVFQIVVDNNIVGWYSLTQNNQAAWEIDNFWILPKYIGQGLGRKLFNHLMQTAKKRRIKNVKVISDPNAEGFYLKMGGKRISEKESSIKGRMLPILKFEIK